MSELSDVESLAAGQMAGSAVQAALLHTLALKKLLTPAEVAEIYENALLAIEANQALAPAEHQVVFKTARKTLELFLKRPLTPET